MRPKTPVQLIIIFVLVSIVSMAATGEVEIIGIKPTPFFPKVENGASLKQIVQISVKSTTIAMPFQIRITVEGQEPYYEDIDTLAIGDNSFDVRVLDVQKPSSVKFELLNTKQEVLAEKEMTWQPQKKWKVYYAAVSHQDLGFIT